MIKTLTGAMVLLTVWGCNGWSDEACFPVAENETCASYNHMLLRCHSEGAPNLPNCHVVEYCTDYPTDDEDTGPIRDTESNSETSTGTDTVEADTNTDSMTDSATDAVTPQGRVCKQVCAGKLLPCEEMNHSMCNRAQHCEWYDNSSSI